MARKKSEVEETEVKVEATTEAPVEEKPKKTRKTTKKVEEEPKTTVEAAPAKETKQSTTKKVAEKKATPIMTAPAPAKKPTTSEPYSGVVAPKTGVAVLKGPGLGFGKAGSRPYGTHLTIHEVSGNFGRIGTDKWININSIEKD